MAADYVLRLWKLQIWWHYLQLVLLAKILRHVASCWAVIRSLWNRMIKAASRTPLNKPVGIMRAQSIPFYGEYFVERTSDWHCKWPTKLWSTLINEHNIVRRSRTTYRDIPPMVLDSAFLGVPRASDAKVPWAVVAMSRNRRFVLVTNGLNHESVIAASSWEIPWVRWRLPYGRARIWQLRAIFLRLLRRCLGWWS